ncbi:hypothetical protein SEA_GERALT_78 [Mycobacterium phage Geralt]|uniref:DUF7241 domain-containing protein n=10 Tax=Cheoctovirus TaxID=1623281 RepID=A0A249XMV1_9CAUD|nr:hypothetical protein KNT74_gp78 [Mycobacterium phage Geralt]ASZ73072.1 hypothetical protein SEA_GERALT_78 [Mycobacterium phage Geralt]
MNETELKACARLRWSGGSMSDADTARKNGWTVGTRLAGDEGRGETIIEITAIGEQHVLAKTISHAGRPAPYRESLWTFVFRDWREVPR